MSFLDFSPNQGSTSKVKIFLKSFFQNIQNDLFIVEIFMNIGSFDSSHSNK